MNYFLISQAILIIQKALESSFYCKTFLVRYKCYHSFFYFLCFQTLLKTVLQSDISHMNNSGILIIWLGKIGNRMVYLLNTVTVKLVSIQKVDQTFLSKLQSLEKLLTKVFVCIYCNIFQTIMPTYLKISLVMHKHIRKTL